MVKRKNNKYSSVYPFVPIDRTDKACCDGQYDCVYNGVCYSDSITINGEKVWCGLSVWSDPDGDWLGCGGLHFQLKEAGESNVGEYDAQKAQLGAMQCCGDDANEYYKTDALSTDISWNWISGGLTGCCNKDVKCIDHNWIAGLGDQLVCAYTRNGLSANVNQNSDYRDIKVVCDGTGANTKWHDCDESGMCDKCKAKGLLVENALAGEITGEFTAKDQPGCCGDDGSEFFISGYCCSNEFDKVVDGTCEYNLKCGACGDIYNDDVVNQKDVNPSSPLRNCK